jgi:hypothetical protein
MMIRQKKIISNDGYGKSFSSHVLDNFGGDLFKPFELELLGHLVNSRHLVELLLVPFVPQRS